MKNKKLSKIEKMIRFINEKYEVDINEICEINIEEFQNEAIIGIRENTDGEFKYYTVTRKNFEDRYRIAW